SLDGLDQACRSPGGLSHAGCSRTGRRGSRNGPTSLFRRRRRPADRIAGDGVAFMPTHKPEWLRDLFPWEQHALVVNGRSMAFLDEGARDARPVLLLSGNPTWGFLYRDFVRPLVDGGYRVIAPDWIGAGYSDHPRVDAALTFAHHIADLVSLLDQLDLRGFVIVGHDWGGPQGVAAALQRIDRLAAVALMNTWLFTGLVSRFHA